MQTIIPITLGHELNYKDIAPYHSHISVIPDYKDPKALADYLYYLDANDDKYAEYFWWKYFYHNNNMAVQRAQAYCELCEALHMENLPREHITKLREWWVTEAKCQNGFKPWCNFFILC